MFSWLSGLSTFVKKKRKKKKMLHQLSECVGPPYIYMGTSHLGMLIDKLSTNVPLLTVGFQSNGFTSSFLLNNAL